MEPADIDPDRPRLRAGDPAPTVSGEHTAAVWGAVKRMRLLAWNMRQGGGSRLARIADALVARDADILVLSEYRGGESATRLLAGLHALGYRYVTRVAPPPKRNGVPIAARCAFREHGSIGSGLPEPYRTMPVTSRIDVHESEPVVVLQKLEAWDLPGNNLAEDAVGIGFHLSLSRQLIIVVTSPY